MLLGLNIVLLANGPSTARQMIWKIKVKTKPVPVLKLTVKGAFYIKKKSVEKK